MAKRLAFLNDWTSVFLGTVERVGNALPHPATLFALLAVVIVFVSALAAGAGLDVANVWTDERSMFSLQYLTRA